MLIQCDTKLLNGGPKLYQGLMVGATIAWLAHSLPNALSEERTQLLIWLFYSERLLNGLQSRFSKFLQDVVPLLRAEGRDVLRHPFGPLSLRSGTTRPPAFSFIAAAIVAPIAFDARRRGSASRCA